MGDYAPDIVLLHCGTNDDLIIVVIIISEALELFIDT